MTEKLKTAIENLYTVFSKYPGNASMSGSSNYDDLDSWNKQLYTKKLRKLTEDDLSRFVGKVITTWGGENDFKHFLPRILELTAELNTPYDIWVLYGKLEIANYMNWPLTEQTAIHDFTRSLWDNLLSDNSEKAEFEFTDYFHAIVYFYPDFASILKIWEDNTDFSAIKYLVNYVLNENHHIFENNFIDSRERNTKDVAEFKTWLCSEALLKKIEQAFYRFEKDEIAEKISWVEKILLDKKKYSV